MEKFVVQLNLEHVRDARAKFNGAARAFGEDIDTAMKRLIHESAAQMMSAQEVAKLSGFSTAQIKARMKQFDLNPTKGKRLLSRHAAAVLETNAQLLGIKPTEMDLMSPLAYLPAGDVSAFLETQVKPDVEEALADDYQANRNRIEASIHLGIVAEQDWDGPSVKPGDLTLEQISWLASWLAGEGVKA